MFFGRFLIHGSSLCSVGIHPLVLEWLLTMVFCVFSRVVCAVVFSLDNLGFSVYAELASEALQDSSAPLTSTASGTYSSAPSSGGFHSP